MKKNSPSRKRDSNKLTADRLDVAFKAAAFRPELDALLKKHNAVLGLGWDGKWAKVQIIFRGSEEALTIIETKKGGAVRYVLAEVEEQLEILKRNELLKKQASQGQKETVENVGG